MGIQDKQLLFVIRRILSAPIRMQDGSTIIPDKGTPQGGIISPLLANIVLNELDWWVASQWEENPLALQKAKYRTIRTSPVLDKGSGYNMMRKTRLKEMHIIRYADDFRIFCKTKEDAVKTKEAVTRWIEERLRLEVSPEKTRIVNTRKRWSEFLGFKIRVIQKNHRYIVKSAICDKKAKIEKEKLVEQAKHIAKPREKMTCLNEIRLYIVKESQRKRGESVELVDEVLSSDTARREALGMLTYFADPYSSWQRGGNENRNGRIRRYLPKGTSFEDLTQDELDAIVGEINDTPMKLLGYKTPDEVWDEEMAKLQSKQADPKPAVALTS